MATRRAKPAQIQLRRRLRDGLTATVQYTYAKAFDDASAFSGAGLGIGGIAGPGSTSNGTNGSGASSAPASAVASIAQDWRNLRGERGPSTFDQRNLLSFTMQYTTGEGIRAAALMSGWRGSLFKGWTVSTTLTVGSGLPLTPIYQTNVTGIGMPWTIRPDYTGAPMSSARRGKISESSSVRCSRAGPVGRRGQRFNYRSRTVWLEFFVQPRIPIGQSNQRAMGNGRNQCAEHRDVSWMEYFRYEPAVRSAESGESDADFTIFVSVEVLSDAPNHSLRAC